MKIRALIVDDEPLARQRIRLLAADEPGLEFIGECANGQDALAAIHQDPPDLLFLDVQMPEMDGFQLLQKLPRERLPVVIFTTASVLCLMRGRNCMNTAGSGVGRPSAHGR